MIKNDEQLGFVRRQLALIEEALLSIKHDVLPKSQANFRWMAEAYVDQINELRVQIDDYLGMSAFWEAQSDVVIELQGRFVRLGEIRSSEIARVLEGWREAIRTLMALETGAGQPWMDEWSDPPLAGVGPASVKIRLAAPTGEDCQFNPVYRHGYESAVKRLALALEWAAMPQPVRPEMDQAWLTVLNAMRRLVPAENSDIETLRFSGRLLESGGPYCLARDSGWRIDEEIHRLEMLDGETHAVHVAVST
jgi:hypothetical protein